MSLYKIYRPKELKTIIGNDGVIESLQSVLNRKSGIPSAFFFTGPSGCGKTTLARIVASELGCTGLDFREIDSADFGGIDTIREVRRQMNLHPIESKCRIWFFDECHKLSSDAQTALLKALETTPPNVYFLLATTETSKILKTIRNRCSQFTVSSLQPKEIRMLLDNVLLAEKVKLSEPVLDELVEEAQGSARSALVLLDSIIDMDDEKLMIESLKSTKVEEAEVIDLCRALFKQESWKKIAGILKAMKTPNAEGVRLAIITYCAAVMTGGGRDAERAYLTLDALREPLYSNGWAGLVLGCYEALR